MVAYKTHPGQAKDYQKQHYRLSESINNDSIDNVVRSHPINEFYQKRVIPTRPTTNYLSQPIWFYEIMKKIAADEAEKKKIATEKLPEYSLN
jgi:hypothetical protein